MDGQISTVHESGAKRETNAWPQRMQPAVETVLTENHRAFLRFLARRLGDEDTAEEVLQQFYLRVVSRSAELRKAESVVAWLYTVLRTTLVDHYRREASRRNRESNYALMQTLTEEPRAAEPPDRTCACLHEVLPTLRPEYSDVLRRVDLGETPPREVAVDLGIAANNLRVRLHRARQALKRALLLRCGSCAGNGCYLCDSMALPADTAEQYQKISS